MRIPQASVVLSFYFYLPCLSVSAGSSQPLVLRWERWVWTSHGSCWWWWALLCGRTGSGGTSHIAWPAGPSWACWKTRKIRTNWIAVAVLLTFHFVFLKKYNRQKCHFWVNFSMRTQWSESVKDLFHYILWRQSLRKHVTVGSLQMSKLTTQAFRICINEILLQGVPVHVKETSSNRFSFNCFLSVHDNSNKVWTQKRNSEEIVHAFLPKFF